MLTDYVVQPTVSGSDFVARRVLFLLKHRDHHDDGTYSGSYCSGLGSSTRFIADMLVASGIHAEQVSVTDANEIDREVTRRRPTDVVLEALWVTPVKLKELIGLHPSVRWIVHLHSELPFLANEGVAIEWLNAYVNLSRVVIGCNSESSTRDLRVLLHASRPGWTVEQIRDRILYLPNYYPLAPSPVPLASPGDILRVGCFSAVRPMKNQLVQAAAAIEFARDRHMPLEFHINVQRQEQGGENNLKNLRAVFENTPKLGPHFVQLVEHQWLPHDAFLALVAGMNVGMQVSLSETFNIVAADMAIVGLPMVVSPEVGWASPQSQCSPTSLASIVAALHRVTTMPSKARIVLDNKQRLIEFCRRSRQIWEQATLPLCLAGARS